jgi:ABC-type lipoprotein release transport system permease subunit
VNVYLNLFLAAAANLARYRLRSVVVVICLVAICGSFVTGIAISEGVRADAEISVQEGADLYLTLDHFGRNAPVPLHYLDEFRSSPHITAVVPRIVGRANAYVALSPTEETDSELVVVLGLDRGRMALAPRSAEGPPLGELRGGEIMIGSALADHLGLRPGQDIRLRVADVTMPFRVSAIFPRSATIWSAQLVCMNLDDAGKLFALPGYASDFLIYCRPGPGNIQAVRQDALAILGDIPYRLQTKTGEVASYVDKGFRHQQGLFTVFFLVAFAVGIPALLIASGLGLSDRKREISICKAVGWQTTDVLRMVLFEQVLLSVLAACLAYLTSYVWVRGFNGVLVARFFISELGSIAPFEVPASFGVAPLALALLLCLTITLTGGLYTSWRLAVRPPAEGLR